MKTPASREEETFGYRPWSPRIPRDEPNKKKPNNHNKMPSSRRTKSSCDGRRNRQQKIIKKPQKKYRQKRRRDELASSYNGNPDLPAAEILEPAARGKAEEGKKTQIKPEGKRKKTSPR